jgi:hypothetical protein
MDRATDLGFYTDMPLYHGMAGKEFSACDLAKGAATSGAEPGRLGVWTSLSPEIANEFAGLAAKATGESPRPVPLYHRADKPAVLKLSGKETNAEIAATLQDDGFDAVMMRNHTAPAGKSLPAVRFSQRCQSRRNKPATHRTTGSVRSR